MKFEVLSRSVLLYFVCGLLSFVAYSGQVQSDRDQDGLEDKLDLCPGSLPGVEINTSGCDRTLPDSNDSIKEFIDDAFEKSGKTYVFSDFIRANYEITYDLPNKLAKVKTLIHFKTYDDGYPIFDSVNPILMAKLNLENTQVETIELEKVTKMLALTKPVIKNKINTLQLETNISLARLTDRSVSNGFFVSDLEDRSFLEKYVPANLQYDQVQMNFDISIVGTDLAHKVVANGEITKQSENRWSIKFRNFYNCTSLFFHIFPDTRAFKHQYDTYKSIDGRELKLHVYSRNSTGSFMRGTKNNLKEFEGLYGPWPHPYYIVYATGFGGMEYAGATMTSGRALRHEMNHAYFARGLQPATGNDGWLDEAIASWGDQNYPGRSSYRSAPMASHSRFRRDTDKRAYSRGRDVMSYLNRQLESVGGLNLFLKRFHENRKETIVTTEVFQKDLEQFSNMSFSTVFDQVYGRSLFWDEGDKEIEIPYQKIEAEATSEICPFHHKYTDAELLDLM